MNRKDSLERSFRLYIPCKSATLLCTPLTLTGLVGELLAVTTGNMNIVSGGAAQSNQTVISAATIVELAIIGTAAKIMFVIQTREEFYSSYYRSIE